jgi:3-hydroxyisobutyrate dehydrogenase
LQQNFPTPLVSVAEQVYLSALTLGFGSHDDAGMVRTYYTHPISKVTQYFAKEPDKLQSTEGCSIIIRLLKAIHLCAAAEAIAFAHHLGIGLEQFYELCIDAAGGSAMLRDRGPLMMGVISGGTPKGQDGAMDQMQKIHDITQEMEEVLQAAQKVQSPLHLGAAARNLLLLAERKLGNNARDFEIVRFWQFLKVEP